MAAAANGAHVSGRRPSLAVVATILVSIVALLLAYALNLWQDEAYTLHATAFGPRYAFHEALTFEQNAPLYFIVIALLRRFGEGVFYLRLFSVVCAVGAVALVPALTRRYVPRADAGLVTLVAGVNPFLIWAAVEMRVYAALILLGALLLLTAYDAFLSERPRAWAAFAYAIVATISLYTQYYLLFLIAGQGAAILCFRRAALWRYALAAGGALVLFAPLALAIPGQVSNFRGAFARPTLLESFTVTASILARYVIPLLFAKAKLVYLALAALLVAGGIAARRSLVRDGDARIIVITIVAAVCFALGTYVAGVHVLNRHVASLYIPAILTAFAALSFVRPERRAGAMAALTVAALATSLVAIVQTYAHVAKPGDWIRVTAYLAPRDRRGEPIVVFQAENALPFAYYYRGPNAIVPLPRGVDFAHYDVSSFIVHDDATMQRVIPHTGALWLITAGECFSANIAFGCDVVERYVAAHFLVRSDASFYESRVRLLIPKS